MKKEAVLTYLSSLSEKERISLLREVDLLPKDDQPEVHSGSYRKMLLDNKQGNCPHCNHTKYVKFGIDKGSQRYKCKSCKRSFTQYSGTWMAGIHHKAKIDSYMELMIEEQSLDKIKVALKINKKTAFDWRHKILSAIEQTDQGNFTGITESDETFFLESSKGKKVSDGTPRKRGGSSKSRGVNNDHIAVIVTQDRKNQMDLTLVTKGRLKKVDIEKAIGHRLTEQTVLCSDSHLSYKGFAIDNQIEHHPLRSDLKQRVKDKIYHIQHVNSTHHKVKKWIDNQFWGVSTKYLHQYLNWFRLKQIIKDSKKIFKEFVEKASQDINAYERYRYIDTRHFSIINAKLN